MFKVYALTDETGAIRYIGSTARRLSIRRAWHIGVAKRGSRIPVAVWITEMLKRGRRPGIQRIAETNSAELAASIEAAWIAHFREQGDQLLNVCDRAYVPTIAHRRAISNALRGRMASRSTRYRMAVAQRQAWRERRAPINAENRKRVL